MKRIAIYVIGVGIFIGAIYLLVEHPSTQEFKAEVNEPAEMQTVEPTPSANELLEAATQALIEEAIAAKQSEIDVAKEAAATQVEKNMKLEIEAEVRDQLQKSNEERIIEIEKETLVY